MSRDVLFTDKGERVPVFFDKLQTDDIDEVVCRHGWREVRVWRPGFVAERWGKRHWRLWKIPIAGDVRGSMLDRAIKPSFAKVIVHPIQRWPTIGAIEMLLRHLHARL